MAKFLFSSRWILAIIFLLLDIYSVQALFRVGRDFTCKWFSVIYILFSLLAVFQIVALFWYGSHYSNDQRKGYLLSFIVAFLLVQVSISVFMLIDDFRRLFIWIYKKIAESKRPIDVQAQQISRSAFLSWAGIAVGSSLFAQPLMLAPVPLDPEPEAATSSLTPEDRARAAIDALAARTQTAPDMAEFCDHLSLLRRWYYRPEKQREAKSSFRTQMLPGRSAVF